MPSVSLSLSLEAFTILQRQSNKSAFADSAILAAANGPNEGFPALFDETEKEAAIKEKIALLAGQIERGEKEKAVRNAELFSHALAKTFGIAISPNSLLNRAVEASKNEKRN